MKSEREEMYIKFQRGFKYSWEKSHVPNKFKRKLFCFNKQAHRYFKIYWSLKKRKFNKLQMFRKFWD